MRLSQLRNSTIKTLDGDMLGHVHEVHCEQGRVTALICGAGSWIERMTARKHGRRVPWECVVRVAEGEVIVTADPPHRTPKKPNAAQNRRGTRRPSARRSKR